VLPPPPPPPLERGRVIVLPCAAIGGSREGGVRHWGEGGRDEATPGVAERGRSLAQERVREGGGRSGGKREDGRPALAS